MEKSQNDSMTGFVTPQLSTKFLSDNAQSRFRLLGDRKHQDNLLRLPVQPATCPGKMVRRMEPIIYDDPEATQHWRSVPVQPASLPCNLVGGMKLAQPATHHHIHAPNRIDSKRPEAMQPATSLRSNGSGIIKPSQPVTQFNTQRRIDFMRPVVCIDAKEFRHSQPGRSVNYPYGIGCEKPTNSPPCRETHQAQTNQSNDILQHSQRRIDFMRPVVCIDAKEFRHSQPGRSVNYPYGIGCEKPTSEKSKQ